MILRKRIPQSHIDYFLATLSAEDIAPRYIVAATYKDEGVEHTVEGEALKHFLRYSSESDYPVLFTYDLQSLVNDAILEYLYTRNRVDRLIADGR